MSKLIAVFAAAVIALSVPAAAGPASPHWVDPWCCVFHVLPWCSR